LIWAASNARDRSRWSIVPSSVGLSDDDCLPDRIRRRTMVEFLQQVAGKNAGAIISFCS